MELSAECIATLRHLIGKDTKQEIEKSAKDVKQSIVALTEKLTTLDKRLTAVEQQQAQSANCGKTQETEIANLRAALEQSRRHSYTFDVLLHGVKEQQGEDWQAAMDKVKSYLQVNAAGAIRELEGYGHRLGPPVRDDPVTAENPGGVRPRPIIFRMRSRAAAKSLIEACGKNNRPNSDIRGPYCSHHLTPLQMANVREKRRATQMGAQDAADATTRDIRRGTKKKERSPSSSASGNATPAKRGSGWNKPTTTPLATEKGD